MADSCGPPFSLLQVLPSGCFVNDEDGRSNSVDVKTCADALCSRYDLKDSGSCTDNMEDHCCGPKDLQTIEISCSTFSYNITTTKSCECKPCTFKTIVNGIAFGRKEGKAIPLKMGEVFVNGKFETSTSMTGVFRFEVPKGINRITVCLHDTKFKELAPTSKVFYLKPGSNNFMTAILPVRKPPITFYSQTGTKISLGTTGTGSGVAAFLTIPGDAVVTATGEPYSGTASITLQFIDPRIRDDLDAATGEFESESPDGSRVPLKTFGMFDFSISDNANNPLYPNKPLTYSMNPSVFNVPLNSKGEPIASLWSYDPNKGTWTEIAKLKQYPSVSGPLQTNQYYYAEFKRQYLPTLYNNDNINMWPEQYINIDTELTEYREYITSNNDSGLTEYKDTTTEKENACYVAVSVYKDLTLREPYNKNDVEVKAYVQELYQDEYISSSTRPLIKGRTCLPIICNKRVYIQVLRGGLERLHPGNHSLPFSSYLKASSNNEILFESRYLGMSYAKNIEGPVFRSDQERHCSIDFSASDESNQFKFAPFAKAPVESFAENSNYKLLSWYPVPKDSNSFRSCFMKVAIKVCMSKNQNV